MSSPEGHAARSPRAAARGAMLVELLVGLGVGAIVLDAAIAALLVARQAASAVNETSLLQQQTSHALRMLGLQIRPAGSAALQASAQTPGGFGLMAGQAPIVQGSSGAKGANDSLRVARIASASPPGQQEDCLDQTIEPGQRMEASFDVDAKGALRCRSAGQTQPLVTGVAGFKLRYRVRQKDLTRDLRAGEVEAAKLWPAVVAVEVCLDLRSDARTSGADGRYVDCTGEPAKLDGHLHLVTRKLFQLGVRAGD